MRQIIEIDPKLGRLSQDDLSILPRVVKVVGTIDEDVAAEVRTELEKAERRALLLGHNIIPMIIDTYGGEVYSLISLMDAIEACNIPVATIVEGKAMSAGAVLFSCGTEGHRYIAPNATVMLHEASDCIDGKTEQIKVAAAEVERIDKLVMQKMSKNCGHKADYFDTLLKERRNADLYLTPKECKEHNLANNIRIPTFTATVKVIYKFK